MTPLTGELVKVFSFVGCMVLTLMLELSRLMKSMNSCSWDRGFKIMVL